MDRQAFKSQARLFRMRHPVKPEFDAQGNLTMGDVENYQDIMFFRRNEHASYYRRSNSFVAGKSAIAHLVCLGNASKEQIRIRLNLLNVADFRGALPLPK